MARKGKSGGRERKELEEKCKELDRGKGKDWKKVNERWEKDEVVEN